MSRKHFTLNDRLELREILKKVTNRKIIAVMLGKHFTSIYDEINRGWNYKQNCYDPYRAQQRYELKRSKCRRHARIQEGTKLYKYVVQGLLDSWSPEIIATRWTNEHPNEKVSHITIYEALRAKMLKYKGKVLKAKDYLIHHNRRYKGQKAADSHGIIKPVFTIHQRPGIVAQRIELGHFEGDTVMGAHGSGMVVTLVDMCSRRVYSAKSPSKRKRDIHRAFVRALRKAPCVRTITLDNGTEFVGHIALAKHFNCNIYFCDKHAPWQRGTNENRNKLLRFFFPKGTRFEDVTDKTLNAAINQINNRPLKLFNFATPLEYENTLLSVA